jgi:hypothetical protein
VARPIDFEIGAWPFDGRVVRRSPAPNNQIASRAPGRMELRVGLFVHLQERLHVERLVVVQLFLGLGLQIY